MHHIRRVHSVGASLGLRYAEIKECTREEPNSLNARVHCMLDKWKQKKGSEATVVELLQAMQWSGIPENHYKDSVLDYFNNPDSANSD